MEKHHNAICPCVAVDNKGTTINDLEEGPEEIKRKKIGGPSPGKKNSSQKAFPWKK